LKVTQGEIEIARSFNNLIFNDLELFIFIQGH